MHPVTMYTIDALSFLFISDISLRYKEAGGGEGNVVISNPDTSTHSGKNLYMLISNRATSAGSQHYKELGSPSCCILGKTFDIFWKLGKSMAIKSI